MKRCVLACLIWAAMFCMPSWAHAQTCSAAASAIEFGNLSPISLDAISTTGTVAVTCRWPPVTTTPNVLVCLNLNATSPRTLKNGNNSMQYDLYQDAAHSLVWGSVSNGTTPIALTLTQGATGMTTTQTVTVYGQIGGNQPTVPTVGNGPTVYAETFTGRTATVDYGFYATNPPSCATLFFSKRFALNVAATVVNDCTVTATNLNFAATTTTNQALDATGSIIARCTNGDAWRIALSGGSSGDPAARRMQRSASGIDVLDYELYTDSAHSTIWGDGTHGTTMQTGTGTGNAAVITVYGHVPAQATPAPDSYRDTITATIFF